MSKWKLPGDIRLKIMQEVHLHWARTYYFASIGLFGVVQEKYVESTAKARADEATIIHQLYKDKYGGFCTYRKRCCKIIDDCIL